MILKKKIEYGLGITKDYWVGLGIRYPPGRVGQMGIFTLFPFLLTDSVPYEDDVEDCLADDLL